MGDAPSPPESQSTTRGTRSRPKLQALYLFSGAQRKSSVTSVLQDMCKKQGIECIVHEVDIQNSPSWDLSKGSVQQALLQRIKAGEFDVVLVTPPCSTWSRVRGANCRGPPMIRSRAYVWGFPWLSARHLKDAELGNVLIVFMLEVLEALETCPRTARKELVQVFVEHPEDLGVAYREEDGMLMDPASIWQLQRLRHCTRPASVLQLFTVVFNQCCWGAPYRKPTRILTNITPLKAWGSIQWPQFDGHGHYVGPTLACQCRPSVTLARTAQDPNFRTSTTSAYPEAMDHALAAAILSQWASTPLQTKEGAGGGESKSFGERKKETVHEEAAKGQKREQEVADKESRQQPKKFKKDLGALGPPMRVSYKGEVRSLHDGAGLCSPGRWPVSKRAQARSEREAATRRWFEEAFTTWTSTVGEDKAKEIFWAMAGGKLYMNPPLARRWMN